MRRHLIPVLLLGLVAGCSSVNFGPHRIDVQQGNALDQENVARLKPGLNRSQVRFLLGTPLVIDPFRNDRWDYVYVDYKAGKLAEQKNIALFFDGDTLARIEGDLPVTTPPVAAADAQPAANPPPNEPAETKSAAVLLPVAEVESKLALAAPTAGLAPTPPAPVAPEPVPAAPVVAAKPAVEQAAKPAPAKTTSIVPPLPSPKNAPPYVDPRTPAELSLQPETDVAKLKPDAMPAFPEANDPASAGDERVLKALSDWADAWSRRDDEAYLAAYDASFIPQGGGSRTDWEKRRRLLLGVAKNIEVKIDSPSVERAEDGTATATFNQFYRSDSYRDAVVKQVRMTERGGRWLIIEEKVLSILRGAKP